MPWGRTLLLKVDAAWFARLRQCRCKCGCGCTELASCTCACGRISLARSSSAVTNAERRRTAYAGGVGVDTKPATPVPHRIRLALDRREYNADSRFFAVYVDEGAAKLAAASLQVQAIRADGVPINLGAPLSMAESTLQLPADQVSIAAFYQRANPNLRPVPGDIVACTLYPDDTSLDAIVVVEVTVVADPVTPTPQAAYALLRKTGTAVACTASPGPRLRPGSN